MSEPKGPRVELPDDLALELEQAGEAARTGVPPEAQESASGAEGAAAGSEPAGELPRELQLEQELAETRDRYLRLAAELENFRRRAQREKQELYNYAIEGLVKELLPTVDNLERALDHARRSEEGIDTRALLEGIELTRRSLRQTLERAGVETVAAAGEPFDPQVHEAVGQIPRADLEPGRVVEVYQTGYRLKDRLLRPAVVVVSSRPSGVSEPE